MKLSTPFLVVTLLVVAGCEQQPASDAPSTTPHRRDFAPEDFGVGRAHTKNAVCNRQIDQLLGQVSDCYNTRPTAECDQQMRTSSDKIARIKNSSRCRR
jgi:hypothetical protein